MQAVAVAAVAVWILDSTARQLPDLALRFLEAHAGRSGVCGGGRASCGIMRWNAIRDKAVPDLPGVLVCGQMLLSIQLVYFGCPID